jgi:hypothetical protein
VKSSAPWKQTGGKKRGPCVPYPSHTEHLQRSTPPFPAGVFMETRGLVSPRAATLCLTFSARTEKTRNFPCAYLGNQCDLNRSSSITFPSPIEQSKKRRTFLASPSIGNQQQHSRSPFWREHQRKNMALAFQSRSSLGSTNPHRLIQKTPPIPVEAFMEARELKKLSRWAWV